MRRSSSSLVAALKVMLLIFALAFRPAAVESSSPADVVKNITIRAPRDVGYFTGDLIQATIDVLIADGYAVDLASLPRPGALEYWLDLKSIDVEEQTDHQDRLYTLKLIYQNFYNALDTRLQEIPAFPIVFKKGGETITAEIPTWAIGVSALREIALPIKSDPKDYLHADHATPYLKTDLVWVSGAATAFVAILALAVLARDRAWRPFHPRPARVFGYAVRQLRQIKTRRPEEEGYLEALKVLHRGIDQTDGKRVLADDLPGFLDRHPVFQPLAESLKDFFAASRLAFFASDPARSRQNLPLTAIETFARKMAAAERMQA